MKKRIFLKTLYLALAVIIMVASVMLNPFGAVADVSSEESNVSTANYEVNYFRKLPDEWELFSECDGGKIYTTYSSGKMIIDATGSTATASKYYGGLYRITNGRNYNDFTFEMRFTMTEFNNTGRWIGVMYHTQLVGSSLIGYMMNYRCDGRSAYSVINESRAFIDGENKSGNPVLSDGIDHTLKITVSGNTATHYMDGKEIVSWNLSTAEESQTLGRLLSTGGFALIVNQSAIKISLVKITGSWTEEKIVERDNSLTNAYYSMSSGLVNAPTVVCDVRDQATLNSLSNGKIKPSNAILRLDNVLNVIDIDGESLGKFVDIYNNHLKNRIIPIAYINDENTATVFTEFMKEELSIFDMSVMSDHSAIIKSIREEISFIRGMICYNEFNNPYGVVKDTNENYASVAVIPQCLATTETVNYIQARFKVVWVKADSYLSTDIYDCINSGAYGIISEHYKDVYDIMNTYGEDSQSRTAYNVGHRGAQNLSHANSLSGVRLAVENGATHVEIDAFITTDDVIVMMHDATLDSTTNGSGRVESMSYNELMQYRLDKEGFEPEKIPTLEEILDYLDGTDTILIFEIKSAQTRIVDKFKDVLEKKNMKDQVIVITFDTNIAKLMKEKLPEIPTAILINSNPTGMNTLSKDLQLYLGLNVAPDIHYSVAGVMKITSAYDRYLRDRGLVAWYWTFDDIPDNSVEGIEYANEMGISGITNDCPEIFKDRVRFIKGIECAKNTVSVNDEIELTATTYSGEIKTVTGRVFAVRSNRGAYTVIAKYKTEAGYIYTQSYKITRTI